VDVLEADPGEQLVEQVVQVVPAAEARQERLVLLPLPGQVVAVEAGGVEEVALDTEHLAVDLPPLRPGVDADLQPVELQRPPAPGLAGAPAPTRTQPSPCL